MYIFWIEQAWLILSKECIASLNSTMLIRMFLMLPLQAIFKLTINNYLLNLSSCSEKSVFNNLIIRCQIFPLYTFLFDKFIS